MKIDDLLSEFDKTLIPYIYSFGDGSANVYYIAPNRIVYDPVSPMMSNTGSYSGGPPADEEITVEDFEQVKQAFEFAEKNTADHLDNRPKGSGTISFSETHKSYVLKMGSESKSRVENLLRKLIGRN